MVAKSPPNKLPLLLLIPLLLFAMICEAEEARKKRSLSPAIPFEAGLPWLNVSRSLSMEDLRGKVVILDFWTYGCINCIHVLEDFRKLEEKYADNLAVIGVHSPKFDNEKNIDTLRRIVVRYGIEHPVVNDTDFTMAKQYGMRAWPTQFLIDPVGNVLGKVIGEGNYDLFVHHIDKLLEEHAAELSNHELPIALEKNRFADSLLAAPGKIAVSDSRVAISDTLHHRIVLANHDGKIIRTIGGMDSGFVDGSADEARFFSPQGLAFSEKGIYVADTGNHSIRYIDLASGRVKTVAGNGKNEIHHGKKYAATAIGLRSPWDVALNANQLYVAMAGIHQIWRLDLDENMIYAWAGSGRETIDDGSLGMAGFSQPSGLSLVGDTLYVADAEASAVRLVDIRSEQVETLVGAGLFEFGDKDGGFKEARLQHVLGVVSDNTGRVYVADTYNHKLKSLDLEGKKVTTLAGTGKPAKGAGTALDAALNEPGGIAMLGNKILIADTNNNRIMQYDPDEEQLIEWQLEE